MRPRIAIPLPHSRDLEYSARALPAYERAITFAGGVPVRIPLDQGESEVQRLAAGCAAVLLPGSNADVDPSKFGQERSSHTANADQGREQADALLLTDAYAHRKPILGICYGLQSLNVFRNGSLVQHIPDFLPELTRAKVNHEAGKAVAFAHTVEIDHGSKLANLTGAMHSPNPIVVPVNSSHHQSAEAIGEDLRAVARCPEDGIIEALEGTALDHFVLAVQWHPERSVDDDETSRAIFRALVQSAT